VTRRAAIRADLAAGQVWALVHTKRPRHRRIVATFCHGTRRYVRWSDGGSRYRLCLESTFQCVIRGWQRIDGTRIVVVRGQPQGLA
jgi:hypothetical protein